MLIGISAIVCLLIILSVLFVPELKLGKIKFDLYWVIAMIGAIALIALGFADIKTVVKGIFGNSAINPIKILVLFLSMTGLSVFLDEVGFFKFAAQAALGFGGSSQKRLFFYLYAVVSVLTVFTSNDIIVLTFTPFICYFAKRANISPIPYLVAEFAAANTWSMTFIIGNPTNIYIAQSFNINFVEYFKVMFLPTICSGAVSFLVLRLLFNKKLAKPISPDSVHITIENRPLLVISLLHLSLCTALLAISSYVRFEMWLVALLFFISLVVCVLICCAFQKKKPVQLFTVIKRLPWQLIPFVLSMFVLVLTLSQHGVTDKLCVFLSGKRTAFKFGLSSFFCANLINNIPMSVLYVFIIKALPVKSQELAAYASIIGSNIGAYLTPIGALAGIMWSSILKKLNVKFSFFDFIKYGVAVSVPTILTALFVLSVL